jgi:hypothetical protein
MESLFEHLMMESFEMSKDCYEQVQHCLDVWIERLEKESSSEKAAAVLRNVKLLVVPPS